MLCSAVLVMASLIGQINTEADYKSLSDFLVGGVWTMTKSDVKCEISYKPTLNGRFILGEYMHGDIPVTFLIGIDPVTKKITWFGFDGDGDVVKWVMTRSSDDTWSSEGNGMGPKGECALKNKLTRIDADTLEEELEHFVINGKQMKIGTNIWKRKR